jgi:hypothetical protein
MALLVFVGSCLLADWAFTRGIILRPSSDSGRIQHLFLENSNEMPVFGSSKVLGLDLGLNAYNYGMEAASFEVTEVFLQIELAKPKTTPLIVELQFQDTGILGNEGRFIPFASETRFRQLLRRFHSLEWRYFVPGIRYFGYYDWYVKDYLNERTHVTQVTRGFVELLHPRPYDRTEFGEIVRARLQMTNGYFPDEDQNRRLIALITEHPQRLFFLIVSPYHSSYYVHFQNEEKLKAVEAKLAAFPNVVVIDWGRMHYPDQSFFDTQHLRREAAADFSQKLRDKINQVLRERNESAALEKTHQPVTVWHDDAMENPAAQIGCVNP